MIRSWLVVLHNQQTGNRSRFAVPSLAGIAWAIHHTARSVCPYLYIALHGTVRHHVYPYPRDGVITGTTAGTACVIPVSSS